jgi:hypothetical protein
MYFSSKKQTQLSLSVIFAIALSTATPVMAQQKSEITPEAWPAEIAARHAIETSPQHTAFLTAASPSTSGPEATLASNENRAQRVIVDSVFSGRTPFSWAPNRSTDEPEATLTNNESAARAAISQSQPLKTRELIDAHAKRKISMQAASAK